MRLVTFAYEGKERVGALVKDDSAVCPLPYNTMLELIETADPAELRAAADTAGEPIPVGEVKLLAPIPVPRQDILCIGRNYLEHARESARVHNDPGAATGEDTVYFAKRVNRASASGDPIDGHFDLTKKLDYEAELAVILGKTAKNVKKEQAGDYIFGYTVMNDVSARDVQNGRKQWYFGKSMDSFAPMGPCIVTADEIEFPPKLDIFCRVNGELRQSSNTALFIHPIEDVLADITAGCTLLPGTVIATGTPGGVGVGMDPPRFLQAGDVVECGVEHIGVIKNRVE